MILGEGTVVIAPPGGAMRPYQNTLRRLADEFGDARVIYGGHGERVDDAQGKIAEYIAAGSEPMATATSMRVILPSATLRR